MPLYMGSNIFFQCKTTLCFCPDYQFVATLGTFFALTINVFLIASELADVPGCCYTLVHITCNSLSQLAAAQRYVCMHGLHAPDHWHALRQVYREVPVSHATSPCACCSPEGIYRTLNIIEKISMPKVTKASPPRSAPRPASPSLPSRSKNCQVPPQGRPLARPCARPRSSRRPS